MGWESGQWAPNQVRGLKVSYYLASESAARFELATLNTDMHVGSCLEIDWFETHKSLYSINFFALLVSICRPSQYYYVQVDLAPHHLPGRVLRDYTVLIITLIVTHYFVVEGFLKQQVGAAMLLKVPLLAFSVI